MATIKPIGNKSFIVGNITWVNNSTEPVILSWIDVNGNEINISTINAGVSQTWGPAYFEGVNPVRDQDGNIVLVYIINGITNQTVTISADAVAAAKLNGLKSFPALRSLPGEKQISNFNFVNNSKIPLNLYWTNYDGVPVQVAAIVPGGTNDVGPVYFGGMFYFTDQVGNPVLYYVATETTTQTVTITDEIVACSVPSSGNIFQLSAVSQNDSGSPIGNSIKAVLRSFLGGTLRSDSSPNEVTLPIPPSPYSTTPPPPTPTWFLELNDGIVNASFTIDIIDGSGNSTPISINGSNMAGWVTQNLKEKTNQIYKDGNNGIFGFAQKNDNVNPPWWIYTITADVNNPQVNPGGHS